MLIQIPTIRDNELGFEKLSLICAEARHTKGAICFRFDGCGFLMQNAVAVLGGLYKLLVAHGVDVRFDWSTLQPAIKANLAQNGFCAECGLSGAEPWSGNSIPFRHDSIKDTGAIGRYLRHAWLGRGWIGISDGLSGRIRAKVYEIYENAFTHSSSPVGVFSCGQYYPRMKRLKLSVVDFGIGIARNVQNHWNAEITQQGFDLEDLDFAEDLKLSDESALAKAFEKGFTTRPSGELGGLGLSFLNRFIQVNGGIMHVFSNGAYVVIDQMGNNT